MLINEEQLKTNIEYLETVIGDLRGQIECWMISSEPTERALCKTDAYKCAIRVLSRQVDILKATLGR